MAELGGVGGEERNQRKTCMMGRASLGSARISHLIGA